MGLNLGILRMCYIFSQSRLLINIPDTKGDIAFSFLSLRGSLVKKKKTAAMSVFSTLIWRLRFPVDVQTVHHQAERYVSIMISFAFSKLKQVCFDLFYRRRQNKENFTLRVCCHNIS